MVEEIERLLILSLEPFLRLLLSHKNNYSPMVGGRGEGGLRSFNLYRRGTKETEKTKPSSSSLQGLDLKTSSSHEVLLHLLNKIWAGFCLSLPQEGQRAISK